MSAPGKLHNIQVLRFIAAAAVVVAHATDVARSTLAGPVALSPDFLGATGVVIFFIVSGFIMVHSTRGRFGTARAPADFLGKRIIRIVPIYWIATLVSLAVAALGSGVGTSCHLLEPAYVAASFLFLAYPRCNGAMQPLLTQGWTLNYEAFFYLAFAFAMLGRRTLGCCLLAAGFAILAAVGEALRRGGVADGVWLFYTEPMILLFVGGIGAALLHEVVPPVRLDTGRQRYVPGVGTLTALTFAVLVGIDLVVPYSSEPGQPHHLTWIVAAIIFAAFAFLRLPSHPRVAGGLEIMGDASYSIYLFHILALTVTKKAWAALHVGDHPILFVMAGTAAALGAGVAIYRWVERPLVIVLRSRTGLSRVPVEFRA